MQQTWVPPGKQASLYHLGADPRSLLLSAASSQSREAGTPRRLNELRRAEDPPEARQADGMLCSHSCCAPIPPPGLVEHALLSGAACGCLGRSCKLLWESRIAESQDSRPQDPSSSLTPGPKHAPYGQVCLLSSCPPLTPVWGCPILRDGRKSEDSLGIIMHNLLLTAAQTHSNKWNVDSKTVLGQGVLPSL